MEAQESAFTRADAIPTPAPQPRRTMYNFYRASRDGLLICQVKGLECSDNRDCRTCNFARGEWD